MFSSFHWLSPHAFNVCMYACLCLLPIKSVKMPRDLTQETFPPPLNLRRCCAGGAPPSLTLPSHLSHPLIHLPPLCSVSLPPTTHHLLRPIITRSTSPFAVTMATAMLGTGPRVAHGHQSVTDHHHLLHQNKLNQSFLHGLLTPRGSTLCDPKTRFYRH